MASPLTLESMFPVAAPVVPPAAADDDEYFFTASRTSVSKLSSWTRDQWLPRDLLDSWHQVKLSMHPDWETDNFGSSSPVEYSYVFKDQITGSVIASQLSFSCLYFK